MKLTYTIDPATRLISVKLKSAPTFEEWKGIMNSVLSDPAYKPGFAFVFDRRSIDPPSTDYIRQQIDFLKTHREQFMGAKLAVVVNDQANLGMFRMAQILGEHVPVSWEVFTDPKDATVWAHHPDSLL